MGIDHGYFSPLRLTKRPGWRLADLAALTQIMVGDHAGHHGLPDRHRPDSDAWIVAAFGHDFSFAAVAIHRLARREDRRRRLHGKAHDDGLAGRDAAQHATGVVRQKARLAVVAHAHLVGVLLARERGRAKARTDLHAFDRIDAHDGAGEIAVELAVDRRAETGWHALRQNLDDRSDRGALLAHAVEQFGKTRGRFGIRAEEWIALHFGPIPAGAIDLVRAHLDQRRAHVEAGHDLAGDGAGGDPHGGLARRGAPAAAIVVQAVFHVVSVAGVSRAIA